jgi:DNA polymerase-3 subunit gamma/tau
LGLAPDEYAALTMVLLRLLAFKPQAATAEKKSPRISPEPLSRPPAQAPAGATATQPTSAAQAGTATQPATAIQPAAAPTVQPLSQPEPPPWEALPVDGAWDAPEMSMVDQMPSDVPQPLARPALRSLPVRESSEPSARVDVPRANSGAPLQETPEGEVWLGIVKALMAQDVISALLRELALQSQLVARDGLQWQLRVERETLNHPASRERLQAVLMDAGHGEVKLHIEIGTVTDSPAKRLAVLAAAKMEAAQELIQNDPLVQAMVRDFAAKIVPGSIQLI